MRKSRILQDLENREISDPAKFAKGIAALVLVAGIAIAAIAYIIFNLTGYSLICLLAGIVGYKVGKRKLRKMARQILAKRTDHVHVVGMPYKIE